MNTKLIPWFVVLAIIAQTTICSGQTTAFTYQGRLNDASGPANGTYDVRFALYNQLNAGTQQGNSFTNAATFVTNGFFTATLDFGSQFPGAARWLEIAVRTNGAPTFTTLAPRQPITPTPYALYSPNAGNATTATSAGIATTATSATFANNFSGALGGDVAGTQTATVITTVGGQTASNIASGVNVANAATAANTASQIVKRDAAGNFSAGAINAASFTGSGLGLTNLNGAALIPGSVGGAQIADGAIAANHLASGAAAANLGASGISGVPSGGVVFSPTESTPLVNAGYVRIGTTITTDAWRLSGPGSPPDGRRLHTAVWTGSEMIVWGGNAGSLEDIALANGARYNPAANSWSPVSATAAPTARFLQTAVWTGSEMIVWGGIGNGGGIGNNSGGRYNPASDSWTAVTTTGAPTRRFQHSAVWTGTEMIIWGGYDEVYNGGDIFDFGPGSCRNDGGRYNPSLNSWTAVATNGAPVARTYHTAVWTGQEMIIWGGVTGNASGDAFALNNGGRYNPVGDTWAAMATKGVLGQYQHTAVWTGNEMIVWGGVGNAPGGGNAGYFLSNGGRYNPSLDSWMTVSTTGAPSVRIEHTAVWTGNEMIVWGGTDGFEHLNNGGRYNPTADSWTPVNPTGAPVGREQHTAIWSGSEMIVWGGGNGNNLNDGGRYAPSANAWTTVGMNSVPAPRRLHTAIWTGSEMIVWGGDGVASLNDGGRFNPAANTWTSVSASGAPAPRYSHTAVWTGTEMIIWGGFNGTGYFPDGGRYNPAGDTWTAVNLTGAPVARSLHTAVYTGEAMIVWGGETFGFIGLRDGGRYNPTDDSWAAVTTAGAPTGRENHTAVWTGNEMIIWGGLNSSSYLSDSARYNPASDSWLPVSLTAAPTARRYHTAVWTGTEMIVWGGFPGAGNDGGRYNPASDNWNAVTTTTPPPSGRGEHSAVWTGSEMIVWGGYGNDFLNDGARYSPANNSWAMMTLTGAPSPRMNHTAVWTGHEMIVWGGTSATTLFNDTYSYTPALSLFLYQLGSKVVGGSAH